jgi:hypothetical protein
MAFQHFPGRFDSYFLGRWFGVLALSLLSTTAYAEVEPSSSADTIEKTMESSASAHENDEGLGWIDSDAVQDLDAPVPDNDPRQLHELIRRNIETAQALHIGDEEIAEPIADEL